MVAFLVGSKQSFEISLADVAQTQLQRKNDVMMDFHVDDTTGANEKDSLMEISFHVFRDKIMSMADVGAGGEEAIVTFDGIAILTPRGRYSIELHLSFLRLQGQANNFKIQYSSVVRVFCLTNHIPLLIRKRQILYPHIVMQMLFLRPPLSMNEDLYNAKYKKKLEMMHKGLMHEVCIAILRGLSSAKVTRSGKFHSSRNGYAVKSSPKAEDGVLYSFEKSFFFLPKPPTLCFMMSCKGPNIMNLGGARTADGVAAVLQNDDDDAVDPHLERTRNESAGHESDEKVPGKKKLKKEPSAPKASSSRKKAEDGDEDGSKKKKPKKKKDPNATKGTISAFMFFSQTQKEIVMKSNPGISFTEVGKVLGERWNKMTVLSGIHILVAEESAIRSKCTGRNDAMMK
ncbi:FACT complex subunit SSRP1 [Olea europaea subsp. europaea]|uniref:FACT complex subunit SSRP1 n=1 Tax=Olea europaea subsp. europaea TaxID=158383 RepID=A0A8S0RZ62_OLEEU|nr:FACT complex subunit SSRP1 [Olea europaea subsp. europaea]